ncbi:hypothetical protein IFO70_25405 [Phormidium tenue FACHB-886]|nr:hypothetical protein [Phormidium tenue FACHB-886]
MILSVTSYVPSVAAPLLLEQVTQALAQDQNLFRIKKLLLFACTQTWENDLQRLEQSDLQELLQQLLTIAPTREQLQTRLYAVTRSLNKPAEYSRVANGIISQLNQLYLNQPTHPGDTCPYDYERVVQNLTCNSDLIRVKKLLLLASRNIWETDSERLHQTSLPELVREVHTRMPTLESLRTALENLVITLSKPREYSTIGDRISQAFQPLYVVQSSSPASTKSATSANASAPPTATLSITEGLPVEAIIHQPLDSVIQPIQPAASGYCYIQQQDLSDLFDLRLELMRANPFKVKVLLFSVLHEVLLSGIEQEQMLRNYELDDLLRILLQTHKLLNQLESKLFSTVRLLPDPSEYHQVAQAVLEAARSLYSYTNTLATSSPAASLSHNAANDPTQIVNVTASLPGATQPGATADRRSTVLEHTCQILPVSPK